MAYNGYSNYQTWNVALWISNDEGLYNLASSCADYNTFKEDIRALFGAIGFETPDGVSWNDSAINADEVNAACFSENIFEDNDVVG